VGVVSLAVVDSELRVRGVKALGVVDASIMPAVPRGKHSAPDRDRRVGRGPGADLGLDPASTQNRPTTFAFAGEVRHVAMHVDGDQTKDRTISRKNGASGNHGRHRDMARGQFSYRVDLSP
jgi:GMC oxidoreductase